MEHRQRGADVSGGGGAAPSRAAAGIFPGERQIRRAGLDYWPRVDPVVWDRWADFEAEIPRLGEPFFFSTEGERDLWSVEYPERTVLIFGKESTGLAPEIRRRYPDRLVRIPMVDPEIRSLNLSTAVALAAYEVARRRRRDPGGPPR